MTSLLLRIFIKAPLDSPQGRSEAGSFSGAVGIFCNGLLFLLKLAVGVLSGSVSIMADALNNLSDASGSVVTLIGFRLADKPADVHHPYGHARAEYLSGLAVAVLILCIGFELVKSSVEKIFFPSPVQVSPVLVGVLLACIAVKFWMFLFNRKLGQRIGSTALLATAEDSRNDCVATSAVLVSALVERFTGLPVDGWMGLLVAAFILHSGFSMAKQTISPLLGEGADSTAREEILDRIRREPKVLGWHDLMVHDYGPGRRYASIHVEMDHREDPLECHEIIDQLEWECLQSHNIHLVIHYDPIVTDDPELVCLREQAEGVLRGIDHRLTLHDFRMVKGSHHMNLVFHVPLPTGLRGREEEIRQQVEDVMNGSASVYHVRITFDLEQ
ncbi:MAG: cation transporter [Oscillospiraceae bacterium]|nr:cation transporter [Oscillospiraceae bacterium]